MSISTSDRERVVELGNVLQHEERVEDLLAEEER